MSPKFKWFLIGWFSAGAVNLIFGVGPDKAVANIHQWINLL